MGGPCEASRGLPAPETDMDGFSSDFTFDLGELGDLGGLGEQPGSNDEILDRNLRAIARRCPDTANRIAAASPKQGLEWPESEEDRPGLVLTETTGAIADPFGLGGGGEPEQTTRVLASRRRPVTEAERLADSIDAVETSAVCVLGFGAGYHCEVLAERFGDKGVIVCFEPDVALLRAVFERVDHSAWMEKAHFALLTEPEDRSAITAAISGIEAVMAVGIKILEHPASRPRLGAGGEVFSSSFADAMKVMRTSLATTLVRSQASLSNMIMNADYYAGSGGIEGLTAAAYGRPAIVVSAGPSLQRNLRLLEDPKVREHAVIICVQTMLKPLLRRGIKPHFVCALDYHELSRRFYEGLTKSDVEGVTLVAEPKANPAILEAFPGRVLCVQEPLLDQLLGPDLAGQKWPLKAGATVAHLCAYLGRHLGCDPLIFVGQDLGFTDGQYYAAGAAIHDVWAGELSPVRTLEMFEWERIVRSKSTLRRYEDVHGRPIYTDEQMATYLAQFEVDFAADTARGLRVIDATEGGVRKAHTQTMTLAEALELYANGDPVDVDPGEPGRTREETADAVAARLEEIAEQAGGVARCSRRAASLLGEMIEAGAGTRETDRLIHEVYGVRDEVRALEPAYGLVQYANQAAALRRYKSDRAIDMGGLDDNERQTAQIERDIVNVEWTGDAADELASLLRDGARAVRGVGPRATSDSTPIEGGEGSAPRRVGALVMYDERFNGLGLPRDDREGEGGGEPGLRGTVRRLLAARQPDRVIVATGAPERVRTLLGDAASDPRVEIEQVDGDRLRERTRAVGRGRLIAPETWRSGLGGLSCYDESFEPVIAAEVMESHGLDAAVLVGPDWELVDPGLIDALVERYREWPESVKISICQAAPGLGGLLVDLESVRAVAAGVGHASSYASIGGLLAYLPVGPQADPIAKAFCVTVPPSVRDAGRRFVGDTPAGRALVGKVRTALGERLAEADAAAVAGAVGSRLAESPRQMELELCTGRLAGGLFGQWLRSVAGGEAGPDASEGPVMATADAVRLIESFAAGRPDTVLTLHGVGDPLMHPGVYDIVRAAKVAGVGLVHLRTDALGDGFDAERLIGSGVDAISVDVLAATPEVYREMAGADRYEDVKGRVESLLERRGESGGLPGVWVLPRITRCDQTYAEIEPFYNGWLMACCCAVIDPVPTTPVGEADLDAGARIVPLPEPVLARSRRLAETLAVRSDGRARSADGGSLGNAIADPVEVVWRAMARGRSRVAA